MVTVWSIGINHFALEPKSYNVDKVAMFTLL